MDSRQADLRSWVGQQVADAAEDLPWSVVAGDASSRRYFRVGQGGATRIAVDSPPATEKNDRFLYIRDLLERHGIAVPACQAVEREQGFFLLDDLGNRLLLDGLLERRDPRDYAEALEMLVVLAGIPAGEVGEPAYDLPLFTEELSRFPQWFVIELLGYTLDDDEQSLLERFNACLIDSALQQPQIAVHRDFHARNLMPLADGRLGLIDFQDMVRGPVTYDVVSLLRDCYVSWPDETVRSMALAHYQCLLDAGLMDAVGEAQFLRWFDLMGLQRHIKVLGTFARLYLRDHKEAYLRDLPQVLRYVDQMLDRYAAEEEAIDHFRAWFRALRPLLEGQVWMASA